MGKAFEQVIVLLLMILVGFTAAKTRLITPEGRKLLTGVVLNISTPAVIISSFQVAYDPKIIGDLTIVSVFAAVSIIVSWLVGCGLWRLRDDGKRRVLLQATIFVNSGFMGTPVLQSVFGSIGVMYSSVYIMVFTVALWTLGVYIFSGKMGGWKEVLLQPGLIAVAVGLPLFVLSIRLPEWLGSAVSGLGSLNTPLAMLIIGALVAEGDLKSVFKEWSAFAAAALRLVALPALALGAFWLVWILGLGLPAVGSAVIASCILLTAMPVAANVAMFASMFSVKPQFAAQTVLVSTLLSVVTLPVWITLLQSFAAH